MKKTRRRAPRRDQLRRKVPSSSKKRLKASFWTSTHVINNTENVFFFFWFLRIVLGEESARDINARVEPVRTIDGPGRFSFVDVINSTAPHHAE